jgi:hypothetical protein
MRYKRLNSAGAPETLQLQALENAGALPLCPDFVAEMEPVFNEFMDKASKEAIEEAKQKEQVQKGIAAAKQKAKTMRGKMGRR